MQCIFSLQTRYLMSVNEAIRSVCPSLSVKMALGIGLFNNALLAMGTERHNKYYEAAWKGEVQCCQLNLHSNYRTNIVHSLLLDYHMFGYNRSFTW